MRVLYPYRHRASSMSPLYLLDTFLYGAQNLESAPCPLLRNCEVLKDLGNLHKKVNLT
jgi:hypothetical protein